MDIFKSILA